MSRQLPSRVDRHTRRTSLGPVPRVRYSRLWYDLTMKQSLAAVFLLLSACGGERVDFPGVPLGASGGSGGQDGGSDATAGGHTVLALQGASS
jgi:hypothetical protein